MRSDSPPRSRSYARLWGFLERLRSWLIAEGLHAIHTLVVGYTVHADLRLSRPYMLTAYEISHLYGTVMWGVQALAVECSSCQQVIALLDSDGESEDPPPPRSGASQGVGWHAPEAAGITSFHVSRRQDSKSPVFVLCGDFTWIE